MNDVIRYSDIVESSVRVNPSTVRLGKSRLGNFQNPERF